MDTYHGIINNGTATACMTCLDTSSRKWIQPLVALAVNIKMLCYVAVIGEYEIKLSF